MSYCPECGVPRLGLTPIEPCICGHAAPIHVPDELFPHIVLDRCNSGHWFVKSVEPCLAEPENCPRCKLDAANKQLDKYEQWFAQNAAVLSTHRIGGFKFVSEPWPRVMEAPK